MVPIPAFMSYLRGLSRKQMPRPLFSLLELDFPEVTLESPVQAVRVDLLAWQI